LKSEIDTQIPAVPEVVFEAYIQQPNGYRMTRVRVEGRREEISSLLHEFTCRVDEVKFTNHYQ
jgi:hypothetical protein